LGRDRLDPKAADYSSVLTQINALHPDALYYSGVAQAGVKIAKQAHDIIPNVIKAGGDGVVTPEMLTAAGFPAVEGWYATIAAPHLTDSSQAEKFVQAFKAKFNEPPDDYSIIAYDAASVIIEAVRRLLAEHKPVDRHTVREAIQNSRVPTLQGVVAFDEDGDIKDHTISVFQIRKDSSRPLDDVMAQYHYVGVAPST
jgi:branched-chain amino acid transport system substrate-binding protein